MEEKILNKKREIYLINGMKRWKKLKIAGGWVSFQFIVIYNVRRERGAEEIY